MKIREGFVSNSSSSSFICKGFTIPKDNIDLFNFYKKIGRASEEDFQKFLNDNYKDEDLNREEINDIKREYLWEEVIYKNDIHLLESREDGLPEEIKEQNKVIIGIRKDTSDYGTAFITKEDELLLKNIMKKVNIKGIKEVTFCGTRSC